MLKHPILLPIALMLFLALLTLWISQTVQEQVAHTNSMNRHDPDYMLYNFVSTRTDATGHIKYVLAAAEMRHYPESDQTELQRPRLTQFGQDMPYTQIYGQHGKVSGNGEQVEFTNKVNVIRQATAEKGEMQLQTEKLTIEPNADVAYTDLPVVIRQQPATIIRGTGMHADKKANTIELYNRVHVHYERPPVPVAGKPASRAGTSKNTTKTKNH